ncbi:MAG: hypothetical protein KBT12_00160 [Bacteroidales bacterium]|nr:hypothetical protein [Candidatus Physcousia equi]
MPHLAQIGLVVASLFFWFAGRYMLDTYSRRKQMQQATRHKRHRIHIPKNTTINVDVEK